MDIRRAVRKWLELPEAKEPCRLCGKPAMLDGYYAGFFMNLCADHREMWHQRNMESATHAEFYLAGAFATAAMRGLIPPDETWLRRFLAAERAAGEEAQRWLEQMALEE